MEGTKCLCKAGSDNPPLYYCLNDECQVMLCVTCLPLHLSTGLTHDNFNPKSQANVQIKHQIEAIDNVKKNAMNIIKKHQEDLQTRTNELKTDNFAGIKSVIEQARNKLIELINTHFNDFIAINAQKYEQALQTAADIIDQKVKQTQDYNSNIEQNLQKPKVILPIYKKILYMQNESVFSNNGSFDITRENAFANKIKQNLEIIVDDTALQKIKGLLDQYITNKIPIDMKIFNNSKSKFNITESNYFKDDCQTKYIHYFKENSKELYYIDLVKLHAKPILENLNANLTFNKVNLDIDFKLPIKHSSLIIPTGQIFLFGGADPDYHSNKFNKAYQYEPANRTLVRKCTFALPRISAGVIYFQGFIYLIGGKISKEGYTNKCEKYSIKNDKWYPVTNCQNPSYLPTLCNFSDQFIYKIGGLSKKNLLNLSIEKYNPVNEKWLNIQVKDNLNKEVSSIVIPFMAGAVQLNDKEIYVFGGLTGDKTKLTDNFMLYLDESEEGFSNKWQKGKMKEKIRKEDNDNFVISEFCGLSILHDNRIFCLRSLMKADKKKQLFMFDYNWNM